MLLNGVIVSQIGDLAVAAAFVKLELLVIMGVGGYLLARSYGVLPWLAATIGACIPLSGYTLFMDATSWLAALAATALYPWVWWSLRETLHGRRSPWVAFAVGGLTVTLGNPYSLVMWAVMFAAVLIEAILPSGRGCCGSVDASLSACSCWCPSCTCRCTGRSQSATAREVG